MLHGLPMTFLTLIVQLHVSVSSKTFTKRTVMSYDA